MSHFTPGQRWISESEPELGLGTLVQADAGRVQILFPATGETRLYAADNAPLKRVRFRAGDTVRTQAGETFTVTEVREQEGLITYVGGGGQLPEAQLSDQISFSSPEDRLLAGRFDDPEDYQLRQRTIRHLHRFRSSPVRGFAGGRIDLIPHQLYIAHAVSSRHAPRVLLSDEVGLGKTIEACLILHRLLLSGRAARVLVLVPESLVHQWFVEMLRKFNLWLNIYDEDRCAAIEAGEAGANPFLDDQLVVCSLQFLAGSERRAAQAVAAGWDILVVDEAHHLEWSPEHASTEYRLVEQLGRRSEGLLLLTATPEQLGLESHFARLRLLDPDRFSDFESFGREGRDYREIADLVEKLSAGRKPTRNDATYLARHFPDARDNFTRALDQIAAGDSDARANLINDLLDRHGPGRVLFRNTRAAMPDFPRRLVHLAALAPATQAEEWIDRVSTEFAVDAGDTSLTVPTRLEPDPRVEWLVARLRELEPEKVLLICRTREKVLALEKAILAQLHVKLAVFHEQLSLVQRDRNAAWFADPEGARLLLCSEIGSEGRNFQFAHHLVLFDLPLNPELLEQRIGRLDRIGQQADIHLHIPFLTGSPQEVLARWYHEGLNAFATNLIGGNELLREFGRQVHDVALEHPAHRGDEGDAELQDLLARTAAARAALLERLEQGRDRLLEMNSFRPAVAARIADGIRELDASPRLEEFMLDVFEHFGVHAEQLGPATYHLNARGVITAAFPALPGEGMIATFQRRHALSREDVGFLTWDHPMVAGAMDLLLGGEKGNCAFAVWPEPAGRTLLLEATFLVEVVADPRLHADRFLPPTPVRLVVNHKAEDVTAETPAETLTAVTVKGLPHRLLDNRKIAGETLPKMIATCESLAATAAGSLINKARREMNALLQSELTRLQTLARSNSHIRPQEIELAGAQLRALDTALAAARPRLDSLRLIWKGNPALLA